MRLILFPATALLLTACVQTTPPGISDGRGIGYISHLYEQRATQLLDIDLIEWYQGEEAEWAFREDYPDCEERYPDIGCKPLNGYYIRNEDETVYRFSVAEDVIVLMQTFDPYKLVPDEPVSYSDFQSVFSGQQGEFPERFRSIPFWIEFNEDGEIVVIREQYVP